MLKRLNKLTQKSRHRFAYHACLVVRGGAVVASGYNHGSIHAETMALGKLWPSERRGTKLWSIRITPGGKYASAKPCNDCMNYLVDSGVKLVVYSTAEGKIERMRL